MASAARIRKAITLDELLRLPEIDERPYLEYIDGSIEAKVSPQKEHGILEKRLMNHIDATVSVYRLGRCVKRLPVDGELKGAPVLPAFRLPVAELFGWLIARRPKAGPSSSSGESA